MHRQSRNRPTSMSVSQTHFPNARNVEVHGGHFTNIHTTHFNYNDPGINHNDPLVTTLSPHIATVAMFDSAARHAAGKCHPGTRKKIIGTMTKWIDERDTEKRLLWLYGAAGAGKSAVAHTICELLKKSQPNVYGGSFFFTSGHTDQGNADKLFVTLAHQLAVHFPSVRNEINDALAHDPSLPTKSMEIQFLSLVVQPLTRCRPPLSQSPVFIIDGLDECAETEGSTQSDIVALIAKYLVQHNLCLRFIIASRPEYWIRDIFETPLLTGLTLPLSLRDDVDADKDIKTYLTDGFEKIRGEKKRTMGPVVPPWPSSSIIDRLVYEASGQYIYASTILKFVGSSSRFHNPQERLRLITSSGPHRASAFSELDSLYARILSVYPEWMTTKRVLAAILIGENMPVLAIQHVLDIEHHVFMLVLDALSALINLEKPDPVFEPVGKAEHQMLETIFGDLHSGCEVISFCHRSFGEFLQDRSRSGTFHIDLHSDPVPNEIISGYFGMVHRNFDQNYLEPCPFLNVTLATYTGIQAMASRSTRYLDIGILHDLLVDMTTRLGCLDHSRVAHMNSLFYFLSDMERLEYIAQTLLGPESLENYSNNQKTEVLGAACQKFEGAINIARRRAFDALPLSIDFKATPALVYLLEYHNSFHLPLESLSGVAGVVDAISTMRQYRHTVSLEYASDSLCWITGSRNLHQLFGNGQEPGWRTEGVWRDLRVTLAHQSLKLMLDDYRGNKQVNANVNGLPQFFDTKEISDIHTFEYFQSSNNLAILSAITDLAAWAHQDLLRSGILDLHYANNLKSIFYWINRQLTNPQTLSLLRSHDETLQETLTTFMGDIFEYVFRQPLLEDCNGTGFPAPRYGHDMDLPVGPKLGLWPLPRGFDDQVTDQSYALFIQNPWGRLDSWHRFHDECFGNTAADVGLRDVSTACIIDPSRWHPHLARGLLKLLVTFLYSRVHPEFSGTWYNDAASSFPYLIQCMPYAHPTPENLGALRAIVYLYPYSNSPFNPPWTPPEGLWSLFVKFLQKYDRSILSLEELNLFVKWLNSEEHDDINTYVDN